VKSERIPGGQYRAAAHVVCHGRACDVVATLPMANATNNPEWVAKQMRAKGWVIDGFHAGLNRCPTCVADQRQRRRGESPGAKPVPPRGEIMTAKNPAGVTLTPLSAVLPPTVEQKAAIRRELDGNFDEKLGCYLAGQNDHVIAERLKLPRQMVTSFREFAYGPIKVVPELDALRLEQTSLSERAATVLREATAVADQARDLDRRLVALATRFGIDVSALAPAQS